MATPVEQALAEINRQRAAFDLPPLSGPEQQLAEQQAGVRVEADEQAARAQQIAEIRAQQTYRTLVNAGLMDLARQFRTTQRAAAFDAARRGTTGGSVQQTRTARAGAQAQAGVGGVVGQAQQAANQQFQAETAPSRQQQLAVTGPSPLGGALTDARVGVFQDQMGAAGRDAELAQLFDQAAAGQAANRASNLLGLAEGGASLIEGQMGRAADQRRLDALRAELGVL